MRNQSSVTRGDFAGLNFNGTLIEPTDSGYDDARRVWNAMVDARPDLIVQCTSTSDVVAAVGVARRCGVFPAVRGGGHNVAGLSMSDGGMTIDLSSMCGVSVDRDRETATVQGGALLADLDRATADVGLAVPCGAMSETGIAGLALGGGYGWLARRFGLTCDQILGAEVVLADGTVIDVDATQHADLLWALRGGGGNFGIVTRLTLQAHRFGPNMRLGVALHSADNAAEVLRQVRDAAAGLPEHVAVHALLLHDVKASPFIPPELVGQRMLMVFVPWLADPDDAEAAETLDRLTALGGPTMSTTLVLPFAAGLQTMADEDFGTGHRYYTKEVHLPDLTDGVIGELMAFWNEQMVMQGVVEIVQLGGAVTRPPEGGAAFAHRRYPFWMSFSIQWENEADDNEYIRRVRNAVQRLAPWLDSGIYANMLNYDEQDRRVDAYGGPECYARLGEIKARYDPDNLFRRNVNVIPTQAR
jgi:FAD/FMN-containing dehydrogenase